MVLILKLFLFLSSFLKICFSRNSFHPYPHEFDRAIAVAPYDSWGKQARMESSLRILALGGSNTRGYLGQVGHGFVSLLERFLQNRLTNVSSVIHNLGESGRGPNYFAGKIKSICRLFLIL